MQANLFVPLDLSGAADWQKAQGKQMALVFCKDLELFVELRQLSFLEPTLGFSVSIGKA
jgi:hypothetical protein